MKTISINVNATNVQIAPFGATFVDLKADVDEQYIEEMLEAIGDEAIVKYLESQGYTCEL